MQPNALSFLAETVNEYLTIYLIHIMFSSSEVHLYLLLLFPPPCIKASMLWARTKHVSFLILNNIFQQEEFVDQGKKYLFWWSYHYTMAFLPFQVMLGLMTDQEVKQVADAAYLYPLYQNTRYNIKHSFLMSSATASLIRLSSRPNFTATADGRAHVAERILTKYMHLHSLSSS